MSERKQRLTMADVMDVCRSVGIDPQSSLHGVRIGTTGWRLESGGGIAGNSGVWWLRTIAGAYDSDAPDAKAEPIGPVETCSELKKILLTKWKTLKAGRPISLDETVAHFEAQGHKVYHVIPWDGPRPEAIPEKCLCGGVQRLFYDPRETTEEGALVNARCSNRCMIGFPRVRIKGTVS